MTSAMPAGLSEVTEPGMLPSGFSYALCALAVAILLFGVCTIASAVTGDTLTQVKSRGALRCGVSTGIAGFSIRDKSGNWSGLDVDFCRAVAAAVLGDPGKVVFVPLAASGRFPALKNGAVDLLLRNTTWTSGREAVLKLMFAGVLFHDGQAFMVPVESGVKSTAQLKGATVCVEKGTTHLTNLAEFSEAQRLDLVPLVIDSVDDVAAAFFNGKCRALTSDASQLAAMRVHGPGGPERFAVLPERISKEPLGPVVRFGDDNWFTLVRWVMFALVAAEDAGITRERAGKGAADPLVRRELGSSEEFGKALGVDANWAIRAVQSVGNYGELYERNIGRTLGIERGLNGLSTQGGLLYAPPLR